MYEEDPFTVDPAAREAVILRFQKWARAREIDKPKGRHVVRFCADMWVARTFPGDLGIPTVWGILRSVDAFSSRPLRSR